ncbi:MAG: ATP-binding protein, partial [Anaerolineae bacterium]|nr:ATP-binding protein [Anaerolineae bacterium]
IKNVRPILENAVKSIAEREEMEHSFVIEVPDNLPVFEADPDYLKAAVVQLLDNAAKFSPADKPVIVGAATDDHAIRIWVEDQGRGIPPQERKHILDSFYQINRALYEDQGAGVGLAIVKRILDLSLGHLDIESEPGVGSIFTLVLPA